MGDLDTMETKEQIRKKIIQSRNQMTSAEVSEKSSIIVQKVLKTIQVT